MSKYLFIVKPKLKKGEKITSVILSNNKGEIVFTDWSNVIGDKELLTQIRFLEKLDKKLDKKLGIRRKE